MKRILTYLRDLLNIADVKSGAVLFIFTANVIGMLWFCVAKNQPIDGQIGLIYLGLVTAFTTHGLLKKQPPEAPPTQS